MPASSIPALAKAAARLHADAPEVRSNGGASPADAESWERGPILRDLRAAGYAGTDEEVGAFRAALRTALEAIANGAQGGKARTPAKAAAVRANGAGGGRPAPGGVYRAYAATTEWMGRPRATIEAAQADADRHNQGCADQGGYGSAIVVRRDEGGKGDRCETLDGATVGPPHGRSSGAVRWL